MSDLTDPEGFPLYSIDDYKQQYKSSILTFSRNQGVNLPRPPSGPLQVAGTKGSSGGENPSPIHFEIEMCNINRVFVNPAEVHFLTLQLYLIYPVCQTSPKQQNTQVGNNNLKTGSALTTTQHQQICSSLNVGLVKLQIKTSLKDVVLGFSPQLLARVNTKRKEQQNPYKKISKGNTVENNL